jgi:hypothetical protein
MAWLISAWKGTTALRPRSPSLRVRGDQLQRSGAIGFRTDETDAELDTTVGEGVEELSSRANEGAAAPAGGRRRDRELGLGADEGAAVIDMGSSTFFNSAPVTGTEAEQSPWLPLGRTAEVEHGDSVEKNDEIRV